MASFIKRHRPDSISEEKWEKINVVLDPLTLTDEILEKHMAVFREQMQLANSPDENIRKKSNLLMMNTFLRMLLDGTEEGEYLGLDLGGTNFRVLLVRFKNGVAETSCNYYNLKEETLRGPAAGVFDFIAESIEDFLHTEKLDKSEQKIPLGFTFSFPSTQLALNKSILLTWTKTFTCPDGVGEDPVAMLEAAIERKAKNLPVNVVAVMSDTVSTLMAGNYYDKNCRIGMILGTGCNAAFVENISDIEKWTGDFEDPKHVIVNVELGSTGDNGCMDFYRSEFEKEVDKYSNHPGSFTFEKSFSGMYLGELVRLVLVRLVKDGLLFNGEAGTLVDARWKFTTEFVTNIEKDGPDSKNIDAVLSIFGISHSFSTQEDRAIVKEVCDFISRRGAHIIAAAVAVIVNYIKLPEVTIGIDGSLYERHPKFHDNMMDIFTKFCPQTKVKLILVKEGSGEGAAFAAVSALRQLAKGLRCS